MKTLPRFALCAAALAAVAVLLAPCPSPAAEPAAKNILLIGWDGAQRDHVKELLAKNELPTLAALAKEGAMVDIDVVTGATDTKAGWTQILTGYRPRTTGVFGNGRYQPIPVGYTIFERAEKFFDPENIETRAIIGKKGHVDAEGPTKVPFEQWQKRQQRQRRIDRQRPGLGNVPGGRVVEEDGKKFVMVPGKPYFNTKDHMDLFVNGLLENEKVGETALANLEECKDRRFLFFVHFAEPDHAGHRHGENSTEYSEAIQSDDAWTGKILAKLKEWGIYDKTLVYVVVDHGFNEGKSGHAYAPYVFLATNDKAVNRGGVREDIAPTVLKRLGIDLAKIQPPLDGIPLDEAAPQRKAPKENPRAGGARRRLAPRPVTQPTP
jgi:hypothetical protein